MSKSTSAGRVRTTYAFIKAESKTFPVQVLCRVLDVAPSGYYAWLKQPVLRQNLVTVVGERPASTGGACVVCHER